MILVELIIFLAVIWSLAFFKASLKISTVAIALLLTVLSIFSHWSAWVLIALWIMFISLAILFHTPFLRRDIFSAKILKKFREILPPMSSTEREALDAGDVWWESELFCGHPNWQKLLTMPKPKLSKEEQSFIDNQVETLCEMLDDWKIVHENCDLSPKAWRYLKAEKFFGLVIGKEYGGLGFSAFAHSTIVTKIATRSMSAAVDIMVPNSLGPAELLQHYGTDEQKQHYLPRLAVGKEIPCFALTGPEAGSDATAMPDTGIVCEGEYKGKAIIGIRLNWNKRYITLAPIATLLGLAFKLYDPEHLLGEQEDIGITVALIPTKHPGVEIGDRHLPLHLAFLNGPTRGKDVFIPLEWIVGGPTWAGKGWKMLMECLSIGRGISLPALATASSKLCYRMTGAYARIRKQFKMPIGRLEGIQEALAAIGGFTYICEATRLLNANAVDQHIKPTLASAIAKYHLTELGRKIVIHAMDVHAGKAIQLGPRNYLGLIYDAIPTSITVEGANILTRNLIIFGQGAIRCHPYVQHEMQAAQNPNLSAGLIKFDKLLLGHIGYGINNFTRAITFGLTGGLLIASPRKGFTAHYYRQLTRMSTALALVADVAMGVLGGKLKRSERLSARLGDVLSHLYLASAVLQFYEQQGRSSNDIFHVRWALEWCLHRIQIALDEFFVNFPSRWLGFLLRYIIFPWGSAYKMPSDETGAKIAEEMLKPSLLRDRLCQYCYIGKDNQATAGMENAFQAIVAAEPAKVKLQNAIHGGLVPRQGTLQEQTQAAFKAGILSAEEIKLLQDSQTLYFDAIQVDEFNPKTLARKRTNGRNKKQ